MSDIQQRDVELFSEGTRIAAEIFTPSSSKPAEGYPAILLCHGWGGLKDHLARYARKYAESGYLCMTFDYRGWGQSDGRVIAPRSGPPLLEAGERTMKVQVLREIVDPIDQTADIKNCLHVLASKPDVDSSRIGIWGTSYGGGHAVFTAGNDERIKAVVAQIGGFGFPPEHRDWARGRAAAKARGEIEPLVPQNGQDGVPGLKGTPDVARMVEHSQLGGAARVRVPTLIIDAEFEELNNRLEHGFTAYMMIRQNAPAEYHTYPCKHYVVYDEYFEQSTDLAVRWFGLHL
ncbi:alpha/beta hydrolase [Parafrankia sp. BMG5.11]|uniref:alpha/beta hydrolase n=1 Tax=Parafrankia sp. BMG5.11 TaxID=222540 RepID=UPI00103B7EA4|nr:alpha/beta fold hydrolase [Parafrankia sp. BMG5.11]TCJ38871.1 alpha/beta fold hydrolase [Parafrankia sp. BMG5.11]